MTLSDPRYQPLVELDTSQLREMVAPVTRGAAIREVIRLDGGLVNTVYQVELSGEDGVVVRVYPVASAAEIEAECRLLLSLAADLPVPNILWADPAGERFGHRYVVYRWMEGITLDEYRRGATGTELACLAGPIAGVLARVAGHRQAAIEDMRPAAPSCEVALRALRTGLARERIGPALADPLEAVLADHRLPLEALDERRGLMHGDFCGRNVLVAARDGEPWRITAVVDWDGAALGSPLWDVGSFFRSAHRYDPVFRAAFERGYAAAGGELPDDWWRLSRVLDATRVVQMLEDPRPLPRLFAECRLPLIDLLADLGVQLDG